MRNGISVYAGLGYSIDENIALIKEAALQGMSRLFTSLQIPEAADDEKFFDDFAIIVATAMTYNFEIIVDVNSENISEFSFADITLRLDDGFDVSTIAELSKTHKIMLNASVMTRESLILLVNAGANFKNISALHNFYPHLYTGLDEKFFIDQNKIFRDFGIAVGAFVPSLNGRRRPPFFEGLPTVESCRNFSVDLSSRFLVSLDTDFIIIGDSFPTVEEIESVAEIDGDEIIMQAKILTNQDISAEILKYVFTCRPDISKSVIRGTEGRQILKLLGGTIEPENSSERKFGDITVDNKNFGRYAGEVQIVKNDLPCDLRVNTIATVLKEENFLLQYIKPRQKFSFRLS